MMTAQAAMQRTVGSCTPIAGLPSATSSTSSYSSSEVVTHYSTKTPFRKNTMKTKSLLLSAAFAVMAFAARAQSGGNFDLKWSTIDSGGGTSSAGQFSLSGTIGQPDAGKLTGGQFTLEGGFWSGVSVVQIPGAPTLKIKLLSTGQALISWPLNVTGFTLQEATSVSNPTWNNSPHGVVDTQTEHTVTVP